MGMQHDHINIKHVCHNMSSDCPEITREHTPAGHQDGNNVRQGNQKTGTSAGHRSGNNTRTEQTQTQHLREGPG